ncbi:MAG: alcohol dehydrogenase catalytic domain-containing protein, partial [Magnetococcales bacterium]|nr:alcohol dehydrogenase catalytic domain-containing protein [Magnetococcales bacterium]
MKAWIVKSFGEPSVLERVELPRPEPGPGEVLVEVAATSVNPVDVKIRRLGLPIAPELPGVLHGDVAGVVVAVGAGVTAFRPGDEVFGCAGGVRGSGGALAEFMVADARLLAHRPRTLTLVESAALPLVAITAWEAMIDKAVILPGDRVLVHAGVG